MRLGPPLSVLTQVGQDQSDQHLLKPGASGGTRQGSLQQHRSRLDSIFRTCTVDVARLVCFHCRSAHSSHNKEGLGVVSGHFLYVTVPEGGLKEDWATFQSPRLEPANSTNPCKVSLEVIYAKSPLWHRLR